MTKRVNAEEVVAAYRSQNITPAQGVFSFEHKGVCYGCALTALYKEHCGVLLDSAQSTNDPFGVLMEYGFKRSYLVGFIHGFDSDKSYMPDNEGLADGIAARKAVEQEFGDFSKLQSVLDNNP